MKTRTKDIGCLLIDCGSARQQTNGLPIGFFFEGAPSPFIWTFIG
jgi:hypothetical protein